MEIGTSLTGLCLKKHCVKSIKLTLEGIVVVAKYYDLMC